MDKSKRERLEAKGWKVGTVAEFLELTPAEAALVEIKLALSRSLKERRQNSMTQADLAARLHSCVVVIIITLFDRFENLQIKIKVKNNINYYNL